MMHNKGSDIETAGENWVSTWSKNHKSKFEKSARELLRKFPHFMKMFFLVPLYQKIR